MTDIARCADCPKLIVRPAKWRQMPEQQRRDPRFSRAIAGRCRGCYQRHRRAQNQWFADRAGFLRERRHKTFCGCGCWIWVGEDCPACRVALLGVAA